MWLEGQKLSEGARSVLQRCGSKDRSSANERPPPSTMQTSNPAMWLSRSSKTLNHEIVACIWRSGAIAAPGVVLKSGVPITVGAVSSQTMLPEAAVDVAPEHDVARIVA